MAKRNREEISQYLYDYGKEKTCEIFHLNEKDLDSILYDPVEIDY